MFCLRDWRFSLIMLQVNHFPEIQWCGLVTFLIYDFSLLFYWNTRNLEKVILQITILLYENQGNISTERQNLGKKRKFIYIYIIKEKKISSRHSNCWRMKTILLNGKSIATFVHKVTYITSCHWTLNLIDTQ